MKIALFTGGSSAEREISINSARNFSQNILNYHVDTFLYPEDLDKFITNKEEYELVVPVIHGSGGEDGLLQKTLDREDVKYLFSRSVSHELCFNKDLTKESLKNTIVSYPKKYFKEDLVLNELVDYPVVAKPQSGGSSIGIYVLHSHEEFLDHDFDDSYLFEQYIHGREFTVGIIDCDGQLQVLPIMEAKKETELFDFTQKYSEDAANIEVFPDNLSQKLEIELGERSLFIHSHFNLKDISRSDFIVSSDGTIYFLEVNTIPGMTEKSWIPKMLEREGVDFSELIQFWIHSTLKK